MPAVLGPVPAQTTESAVVARPPGVANAFAARRPRCFARETPPVPRAQGLPAPAAPEAVAPKKSPKASTGSAVKKPKRPHTAYHFFYDERRKAAIAEAGAKQPPEKVDNNALSRTLGEQWKKLDEEGRRPYETAAATAKAEYDAAVAKRRGATAIRLHFTSSVPGGLSSSERTSRFTSRSSPKNVWEMDRERSV